MLVAFEVVAAVERSEDYLLIGFLTVNFRRCCMQITITAQNGMTPFPLVLVHSPASTRWQACT